jgi:MFS superfamily sulfate permease-like transporter
MKHWIHWLPGLNTLRRYDTAWLPHDIFAGIVLATMLVPVGIAYAVASGLPGIYGLYATIVPLLVYALFGPSRILVLGPDSALAGVILGVVTPLSGGDPLRAATQEYNRATARLHAALLFLAAIALVSPSAIVKADLGNTSTRANLRGPLGWP